MRVEKYLLLVLVLLCLEPSGLAIPFNSTQPGWQNVMEEAKTAMNQAALISSQKEYEVAKKRVRESANNVKSAACLLRIGDTYLDMGKYSFASLFYNRALEIETELLDQNSLDLAQTILKTAEVYKLQRDYRSAGILYERALSIREKRLGNNHPSVAAVARDVGHMAQVTRPNSAAELSENYKKAEALYKRALEIYQTVGSRFTLDEILTLDRLTMLFRWQHRNKEMDSICQRGNEMRKSLLSSNQKRVAESLCDSSDLTKAQALELMRKPNRAKSNKPCDLDLLSRKLNNWGVECMSNSDFSNAERFFTEAITLDPVDSFIFLNRSIARKNLGKQKESISDRRKSLELQLQF